MDSDLDALKELMKVILSQCRDKDISILCTFSKKTDEHDRAISMACGTDSGLALCITSAIQSARGKLPFDMAKHAIDNGLNMRLGETDENGEIL